LLLLIAGCIFYSFFNWYYLLIVFSSITVDYFCSLKIHNSSEDQTKKRYLFLSLAVNLLILIIFKYFDFFSSCFLSISSFLGHTIDLTFLKLIFPVGISFYTLRIMSNTIDVYMGRIKPSKNYFEYALFVLFFPIILAGPIMRSKELLPQISENRILSFDKIREGSFLIFWGLYQKIYIADNLAKISSAILDAKQFTNGANILIGIYAFSFQIYCDFAGYSNIAIGLGKCLGFNISVNFNFPYFSKNPQDFWQRWHITLSNWLRDYCFYPFALILRRFGLYGTAFAVFITFILCGIWHGASFMYVLWGIFWGVLLAVYMLIRPFLKKHLINNGTIFNKILNILTIFLFFHIICLSWLIFRSQNLDQFLLLIKNLFFNFNLNYFVGIKELICYILLFIIVDIYSYVKKDQLIVLSLPVPVRAVLYVIIFYCIVLGGVKVSGEFIYFKF